VIDYIVGLDTSLTCTGMAAIWRQGGVHLTSHGRTGHLDEPLTARGRRIRDIVSVFRDFLPANALVVVEGPSYGSTGGSQHDRSWLWGALVTVALNRGLPVAVVAPQTRAKFAAGNGRASKTDVQAAVMRHWLVAPSNLDESDALALGWIAAVRLGWTPGTDQQIECLAAVRWPEHPDLERTHARA
jgi:Holliday junction resolvasome RuvABC endonuclease subunit